MMQYIGEWVRGLILVIFLAIILDMILPNNATKRYAKVVMGLMIIFMMLTPVAKLYHSSGSDPNLSIDSILQPNGPGADNMPSIGQIEQQGQQMQQRNETLTAEEWKASIVAGVKQEVERDNLVSVTNVNVNYSVDASGQPKSLDGIQITVTPRKDAHQIQPIQPIAPVVIGGSDSQGGQQSQPDQPVTSTAEQVQTSKIRSEIADDFKLSSTQVKIIWQGS